MMWQDRAPGTHHELAYPFAPLPTVEDGRVDEAQGWRAPEFVLVVSDGSADLSFEILRRVVEPE